MHGNAESPEKSVSESRDAVTSALKSVPPTHDAIVASPCKMHAVHATASRRNKYDRLRTPHAHTSGQSEAVGTSASQLAAASTTTRLRGASVRGLNGGFLIVTLSGA